MRATVIYFKDPKCLEEVYAAVISHGLDLVAPAFSRNAFVLTDKNEPVLREELHTSFSAIKGVAKVKTKVVAKQMTIVLLN